MSVKVGLEVMSYHNTYPLQSELSKTDQKIASYIQGSKIIFLTGVVIAAIFNPFSLQLLGLTIICPFSLGIISGTGFLVFVASVVNNLFLAKAQNMRKDIQQKIDALSKVTVNEPSALTNQSPVADIQHDVDTSPKVTVDEPLALANQRLAVGVQNSSEKDNIAGGERPIGLRNGGANCWANSMIQFIMNISILKNKISELGSSDLLYGIKDIFSTYENDRKDPVLALASVDSQNLRLFLNSISQNISSVVSRHEDPHEGFTALSDLLPKAHMKKKMIYSIGNHPMPKEEVDRGDGQTLSIIDEKSFVRTINDLFDFISLPLIEKSESFSSHIMQFSHFIMEQLPGIESDKPSLSLLELIDNFFNNSVISGDIDCEGIDGKMYKYPIRKERCCFLSAPEDLFFTLKRFVQDPSSNNSSRKICSRVEVPFVLSLKKEAHIEQSDANYDLDSFIIHLGESMQRGHYICCVKNESTWYRCDDTDVTIISEAEAKEASFNAYLIHYKKTGSSESP